MGFVAASGALTSGASAASGAGCSFRTRSISSHGKSSGSTAKAGTTAGVSHKAPITMPSAKRRVRRITSTLSNFRHPITGPAILNVRPVP
jgi:hypothetical protein